MNLTFTAVRPLEDLTGNHDFCEIFFGNVEVPVPQRVGEENGGWRVARTTLGHERSAGALNQASFYRRITDELIQLARERGLTDSPVLRRRLTELDAKVRIMRINAMRIISDIVAHGEPGPASSVSRLYNSTLEQDLHEIAMDLLGLAICERDGIAFLPWAPILPGPAQAAVEAVAAAHGVLGQQVSLAWLLRRSSVILPIPGTSSITHLDENVDAAWVDLTDDEVRALDAAVGGR